MAEFKASLENGELVLRIPFEKAGKPSASGKSQVYATTNGNKPSDLMIDGKPLVVSINAYVSKK